MGLALLMGMSRPGAGRRAREAERLGPGDVVGQSFVSRYALSAERPKTRYLVGRDAQIVATMANVLPDRMQDWLVARSMDLPKDG